MPPRLIAERELAEPLHQRLAMGMRGPMGREQLVPCGGVRDVAGPQERIVVLRRNGDTDTFHRCWKCRFVIVERMK